MINKGIRFLFKEDNYMTIGYTPTQPCKKSLKECPVYKGLVGIKLLPVIGDPDKTYANQIQYFQAIIVALPSEFGSVMQRKLFTRYRTLCTKCRKETQTR